MMKNILHKLLFTLIFFTAMQNSHAQLKEVEEMWKNQLDTGKYDFKRPMYLEITEEKALKIFDRQPNFGIYRDNYFVTGIPTNKEITRYNADAKFQISIRHRLTNTVLPFKTFLMLTYTQKCFWDIYADSAPFGDSNYNPGLTLGKPIILENKLRGILSFAFEHESNGQDSINSRSWNYFLLSGSYYFNANFSVQGKVWAGWVGDENKDLYKYRGYGLVALNYRTINDKLWFSAIVNPRTKIGNFNTQLELNLKLDSRENQYLFIQWYNGYGEGLLEYDQYTSMVRIGICIKPPFRNIY